MIKLKIPNPEKTWSQASTMKHRALIAKCSFLPWKIWIICSEAAMLSNQSLAGWMVAPPPTHLQQNNVTVCSCVHDAAQWMDSGTERQSNESGVTAAILNSCISFSCPTSPPWKFPRDSASPPPPQSTQIYHEAGLPIFMHTHGT